MKKSLFSPPELIKLLDALETVSKARHKIESNYTAADKPIVQLAIGSAFYGLQFIAEAAKEMEKK